MLISCSCPEHHSHLWSFLISRLIHFNNQSIVLRSSTIILRDTHKDKHCTMRLSPSPLTTCKKEIKQTLILHSRFLEPTFQTKYFEIILFPVSLLIYIWVGLNTVIYGYLYISNSIFTMILSSLKSFFEIFSRHGVICLCAEFEV